jgi:phosphoribosylcarboxyaminoimidazole (NCAIR) mutase
MMTASGEHLINKLIDGINNIKEGALETSAKGIITTLSAEIYAHGGGLIMKASGEHMVTSIIEGITAMLSEITKAALTIVAMYGAGILSRRAVLSQYGNIMVAAAYNGARSKNDDFYDLGQDAADGYARGIRSKAEDAAREAREMVANAIAAAQREQDSASPSKVFRGLGQDGGEGYALGFGDMVSMVITSVRDMGHAGIFAMQDTISHIKDSVDSGIDFNPVITPVLDLSQMTSGVTSANAMLSSMQLNGLAATAAITIANQHNAALAQAKAVDPIDYTEYLSSLIENTRNTTNAVRENRYAIIDGDSAFDYFDRRLGMA